MSSGQTRATDGRHRRYRFGDFTLDLEGGFLRRGDEEVTLRPKAFDALTYLVERHGRLVTKAELVDAIWPDAAVTDNSLAHCLVEIRRALGDDSQQQIRTVARRGYVFAAPVTTPALEFAHGSGEARERHPPLPELASEAHPKHRRWKALAGALVLALAVGAVFFVRSTTTLRNLTYTQLTNFTDSAVAPALSPDGRMLAFIRGDKPYLSADQVYVKVLPNGEAVQLTHDPRQKYGLAFSPDGSRIAYTTVDRTGWSTQVISVLGGEARNLLTNAAGLTWLVEDHFLFSEIKTGFHMGIVTATANRSAYREVYFPQHERAMAHYSYASPDRRWALVIEMDHRPGWQPCRLVSLDGGSPWTQVGPRGACSSAGWSPDGRWMYFSVAVDQESHLWRQRFPNGKPEQLTFGPTEEDGVVVSPEGSLVTSIGMQQSAIWLHNSGEDRPLSSEGHIVPLFGYYSYISFSEDGKHLNYLRRESAGSAAELWRTDVESGKSEPVLPGISMLEYDISRDGKEVVFTTESAGKPSQLWVAPFDRSSPPRQIASDGESSPSFGSAGLVLFRFTDNNFNYIGQINKDGSERSKVAGYPIGSIFNVSPDGRWVLVLPVNLGAERLGSVAVPTGGGPPRPICARPCPGAWSPDGRFLYLRIEPSSRTSPGKMVAIPVVPGTGLPDLPETGIQTAAQALAIPGSRVIERADIVPGLDPTSYAYVRTTVHRNIFRINVP